MSAFRVCEVGLIKVFDGYRVEIRENGKVLSSTAGSKNFESASGFAKGLATWLGAKFVGEYASAEKSSIS